MLRDLTSAIDGWTANGLRYPLSAILYWPLLYYASRSGRLDWNFVRRCVLPSIFAFAGQIFWALAPYELPASEIGFFVRLSMVWTLLGAMLLFHDERALLRQLRFYVGLGLVVSGLVAMAMPVEGLSLGRSATGLLWILLCGAFFGFYMVSVRCCIPDVDPILAFGVVAQFVSAGTLVGLAVMGDLSTIERLSPRTATLLVASSVLGIAMGHILMYASIQRLGASITTSCQSLMPFVTAVTAYLVLGEMLTARQWLGGIVMVVGATVLLSLSRK